jgi:hypothetical protein
MKHPADGSWPERVRNITAERLTLGMGVFGDAASVSEMEVR